MVFVANLIHRQQQLEQVGEGLREFPVVALVGARQVGKTTLAKQLLAGGATVHHFDLEDPDDEARLSEAAFVLRSLHGLVVLYHLRVVINH